MKHLPLTFLLLITALALPGCTKPMDMTTAVIEVTIWPPTDPLKKVNITLTDKNEVDKLASFFPHVGEGRKSSMAAGWIAAVTIQFTSSDGRTATVHSDPNGELWSEGRGDWPMDPEFKKHIKTLLEKAKAEHET